MSRLPALLLLASLVFAAPTFAARRALFDNFHAEQAGNADWVIDNDQPIPVPDQALIGPATPRTYWTGAISSYGVDLVKRGFTVATNVSAFTYGVASNPYDLSNFDVLVVPEPNTLFSSAEKAAILAFVQNGGGLIAISDHDGSDRNNDGFDSPKIWNDLDPAHALGVHFGSTGDANNNIVQTSANVNVSPGDSVTHGPEGVVSGLAFHNGTTFTLYPGANPTVRGEVWMTGLAQTSTTGAMAASASYGSGRVFFIGDSSPVDDGSANPGNSSIFDGWGEAAGADSVLFLNATLWATRRAAAAGDVTAPVVSIGVPNGGETWKAGSIHAITWTANDNVGVASVDLAYSSNGGASFANPIASGLPNSGTFDWTVPNAPGSALRVRALARDAAGNVGSDSSAADFTIDRWTITASADAHGTIAPSGAVAVVEGASQGFTITPAPGFSIADVLVDGASVGAVPSYTFPGVAATHTIAASFSAIAFGLATPVVGGGSVARTPDLPAYPQGSTVDLAAAPGAGWAFAGWSGDTTSTDNPITLVVNGARSVTATFVDVAPPAVTLLSPNGGEIWLAGAPLTVTWTAADNAGVDSVDVDYSAAGGLGPWVALAHGLPNTGTFDLTMSLPFSADAYLRVTGRDRAGNAASDTSNAGFVIQDPTAGVTGAPARLALARPAPNPSSGGATIGFSLPADGPARLEVIDALGRRIALAEGTFAAGPHTWRWDGRLADGTRARAGLYFVRLVTPFGHRLQRMARLD